jgi:large subunit ribosomal protein L29
MHAEEIRAMADVELDEALDGARREIFNLRFQQARRQLADTSRLRHVRRDVARLLTAQRERALWAEYEAAAHAADKSEG